MNQDENPLNQVATVFETLATGIPSPIRKNFFKAFSQLCTATVDIPVAWLEGKADIIRTSNEARKNIILNIGDSINDKIDVPEIYEKKAIERYASKIIRHQIDIDKIVSNASSNLRQKVVDSNNIEEISEEWLNVFEETAKLKSSQDMQILFGKILANEIISPGSFSQKTLSIVSQLDSDVANAFTKVCNASMYIIKDDRVDVGFLPDFRINDQKIEDVHFGISYLNISILHEYGLLHAAKSSIEMNIENNDDFIHHGGKKFYLSKIVENQENIKSNSLEVTGWVFTNTGAKLLSILNLEINYNFINAAKFYFEKKNYNFIYKND